jgi:hypothetical protein
MPPHKQPLTENTVLKMVARHKNGINARALAEELTRLGYPEHDVQRAMQRALDRGVLELGPKLRLLSARVEAA